MVFTSIPVAYLDAANWQQQQPNHQPGNNNSSSQQQLPPPPAPFNGAGGIGSTRSMAADRARMANVPKPEAALKCPRCKSTNTKFGYYNNYSFSQPRYLCKNCSRYWTRHGALRDVPVGGRRRNKRSKGGSSSSNGKSPVNSDRQTGSASSNSFLSSDYGGHAADVIGLAPEMPPMMFMAPLHHHQFPEFGGGGGDMGLNYGLSYTPISGPMGGGGGGLSFQIGNVLGGGGSGGVGCSVPLQQFPFLAGLEGSPAGLYHPFEGSVHGASILRPKVSTSGLMTQFASAKMEDSRELNVSSQQFLGTNNNNSPGSEQYWSNPVSTSAAWTDISGFSSSSTTSNQI